MTAKRTRKQRAPKVEEPSAVKAAPPSNAVAMGGGQRLSAPMIGGTAPIVGAASIGGSTCTLR